MECLAVLRYFRAISRHRYTMFSVVRARYAPLLRKRTFHFFNSLISVAMSTFELIDLVAHEALLAPCAATLRKAAPIIFLSFLLHPSAIGELVTCTRVAKLAETQHKRFLLMTLKRAVILIVWRSGKADAGWLLP